MKTNEEIVEEFKKTNIYQTARVSGYGKKMEDWLRTTLTTLQAKHAEECYCKDKGVIELIEEAVEAERERIIQEIYLSATLYSNGSATLLHSYLERKYPDVALTPTKTDKTPNQ